jgi:hypothetical protein
MGLGGLSDLYIQAGARLHNYGLWDARGDNKLYGNKFYGNYNYGGTTIFNNYGTFRKSGGAFPGHSTLDKDTTFKNFGTTDIQTGLLVLNGTNSLAGGTLNFGIGASNNFGSISINGNARLTGTLSANLNNGYFPALSNSFPVVAYGAETGMFTNLNLPLLPPGRAWRTNYGTTTFKLKVVSVPLLQMSAVKVNLKSNLVFFSWSAHSGHTYQVQRATNLAPANWVNVGGLISGTNGTMRASVPFGPSPQKFFRIQMQ